MQFRVYHFKYQKTRSRFIKIPLFGKFLRNFMTHFNKLKDWFLNLIFLIPASIKRKQGTKWLLSFQSVLPNATFLLNSVRHLKSAVDSLWTSRKKQQNNEAKSLLCKGTSHLRADFSEKMPSLWSNFPNAHGRENTLYSCLPGLAFYFYIIETLIVFLLRHP